MDWLEEELKQVLQRKMPSPDFASRVTAAAGARRATGSPVSWRRYLAAAAALLLVAAGAAEYREYRGRVAKERVLLALRITADRLNYIQTHARTPHRPEKTPTEVQQ
jgi:hypothetical protein